ncbi:MAG: tRNA lysidine(34) synthetase TilS [Chitinophagaceae bacterium]|nr:tRNA lysidine(34) synthetase TilS [Chitinophagaceae bacterium]
MNLHDQFTAQWTRQFPRITAGQSGLLLAVSGGLDSVVLVDLVARSGFQFRIAHANFQLRGDESLRDEQFVRQLGTKYETDILVKRFDTLAFAERKKLSVQEAARELRYAWFREILRTGEFIVTAHHADDNIETVLMHFFRGTGIEGLAGIQPFRKASVLIRPLLPFRKSQLKEYADSRGLAWVEDSSNGSNKYTRNFFRNSLLPQLKEIFPQVEENILDNITRFGEAAGLYRQAVQEQLKKLVEEKDGEWHIPVLKWKQLPYLHTITWELIRPYHFTAAQVSEVIRLLDAGNGAYIASSSHRILRNRKWMIISPNAGVASRHILIEQNDRQVVFEKAELQLQIISGPPASIPDTQDQVFLDARNIRFPLLLRRFKTGDYFYPLGMQKKKKLSRFLIDLKLSRTAKEQVWVLESDKKILWVIGRRIDNRFRITDTTQQTLQISYRK